MLWFSGVSELYWDGERCDDLQTLLLRTGYVQRDENMP